MNLPDPVIELLKDWGALTVLSIVVGVWLAGKLLDVWKAKVGRSK